MARHHACRVHELLEAAWAANEALVSAPPQTHLVDLVGGLGRTVRMGRLRVSSLERLAGRGLLLDHLPFRIRAGPGASGRRIPAGRVPFDVFWAVGSGQGSRGSGAPSLSECASGHLECLPRLVAGEPKWVVCAAHSGKLQAIEVRWPKVKLHNANGHLRHVLERMLAKEAWNDPSDELKQLRVRRERALAAFCWRALRSRGAHPRKREPRSLDRGQRSDHRLTVRSPRPPSRRPADMPLTTAALEQLTRPMIAAL